MRAAGALLLAIPLLPLQSMVGEIREDSAFLGTAEWVLGLAIFLTIAWLLALILPSQAAKTLRSWSASLAWGQGRWRTWALLAVLATVLVLASTYAFEHRPLLIDGVVQLFQAKIFAGGAVTAPAPAAGGFFIIQNMIMEGGRWYSQYPPGHSALLALGVLLGAPWTVPIALSLATALFLNRFAAMAYDDQTGRLTLLILVLTSFFWFMGASYMNHVSSLAGVAAFLYSFVRWEREGGLAFLAVGGAALGVAFLSRPVESVAIGAVFAGVLGADAIRYRRWKPIATYSAAFLALASLYLWFNAATTGDPLRPGYMELWGSAHGLGFHENPWGGRHSLSAGLRNEVLDLSLLNVYLFEWPIPSLWPLGIALAAGWLALRWDVRLLAAFLSVPAAYFFYWHRDTFLGPRFLYVTIAFVVPLMARAMIEGARRLGGRQMRFIGFPPLDAATWGLLVIALSFCYAIGYGIPARFLIYRASMSSMKVDLLTEARAAGIDRGLILSAETWGSRVIAGLRGLGAGAPVVEKAYRQADLCDLHEIVDRARSEGWPARRVEAALDAARVSPESLILVDVGGGTLARFESGRKLSSDCLDEIRYDQAGTSLFTPNLLANDPGLSGPLIFARDLRSWNQELARRYPDHEVWIYRGGEFRRWNTPGAKEDSASPDT